MIDKIVYFFILLPVSRLPMGVLYILSDLISFIFYHIAGYRRSLIQNNLRNSFPEMSEDDIKKNMRLFYNHLADLMVEGIKNFTISEKKLRRRFITTNPEIMDHYYDQGRNVLIAGGHYNNWEMYALKVCLDQKHDIIGFYTPLTNKFFEKKMKTSRSRYGLQMVPTRYVKDFFNSAHERPYATIFGADQSPGNPDRAYWMEFLSQPTAVAFGSEKYAREKNLVVFYGQINKVKRGSYTVSYELLTDDPVSTTYGEITEAYTKRLERTVRSYPPLWLWSHNRWKHKKKGNQH